ncbi:MAG: hypothetical protein ACRD7E_13045 [Bryobacteraceae bacterium]
MLIDTSKHARVQKWVSPDLDCYPLRKYEESSRGGRNEVIVTKIEEGEPPDSMFEVAPDYVEASPLQIEAAYTAKFPGHVFFGEKMAKIVNERYLKSRSKE